MAETLRSVGLDVGTTTTQLVVSELTVENQAGAFAVPKMEIVSRRILYKSPIHFTPLLDGGLVDGGGIRKIVEEEYRRAGISRDRVDTGAIIITGETSRKENARSVLESLADYAGEFVVATAGPDLESVLAAKGAGAVERSETAPVIHMDIGGGTSNLALVQEGKILATACLNVGGRLVKVEEGRIVYLSPVLEGLTSLRVGEAAREADLETLARGLARALEAAAGLGDPGKIPQGLWTREAADKNRWLEQVESLSGRAIISFSGGVADCIEQTHSPFAFGDMGPLLGRAIRQSRLCQGSYVLGRETIRATVIGAGCHSAQLSGSTVFHRNVTFPLKNLPVGTGGQVLVVEGVPGADHRQVSAMAEEILEKHPTGPLYLVMEQDLAKALGQALALRTDPCRPVLCLDSLRLQEGDYLDVAAPIGPALPVVIKTLVFSQEQNSLI